MSGKAVGCWVENNPTRGVEIVEDLRLIAFGYGSKIILHKMGMMLVWHSYIIEFLIVLRGEDLRVLCKHDAAGDGWR
ncbi:hypothetical protein K449DRAFT_385467 [Hypoxylon sp. EC38]|nr:hypothetical protein K449DRAFT_385467 [Hypoxylon sp. EC38]